jgi:hypothetical protein
MANGVAGSRPDTADVGGGGNGRLQYLELRQGATGEHETVAADGLFVLIGARPRTDWLPVEISRDRRGFLLTGADLLDDHRWPLERRPLLRSDPAYPQGAVQRGRRVQWHAPSVDNEANSPGLSGRYR